MLTLLCLDTAFLMETGPQPKDPSTRWTASGMLKKLVLQNYTLNSGFLFKTICQQLRQTLKGGVPEQQFLFQEVPPLPPPPALKKKRLQDTRKRSENKISITPATLGDTLTSRSTDCPGRLSLVVGS